MYIVFHEYIEECSRSLAPTAVRLPVWLPRYLPTLMHYHIAFNRAYNTGSVYPIGHPEEHIADFTLAIPERKLWRFSSMSLEDQLPLLAESVEEAVRRFFNYRGDIDAELEMEDVLVSRDDRDQGSERS